MGSLARRSAKRKRTMPTSEMRMKPPTVGSLQSLNCLLVRPTRRKVMAMLKITPPRTSKLRVASLRLDCRQQPPDEVERYQADGDVDVEDPVPAIVLGQEAAHQWPDDERDPEDRAEEALVLAALLGCEHVADDRQRDREERASADALDGAEEDELRHVLAEPGEGRADEEDDDADHEDRLAPIQVGQLAPEGHADGARQQDSTCSGRSSSTPRTLRR